MVRVKTEGYVRVSPEGKTEAYRYEIYRPPNDRVEVLPDIPILEIPETAYPVHDREHMTELLLWPLFICFKLYYHDERQLDLEDIHAIMCMVFRGQGHRMEPRLYEKLERNNDMTKELDAKAENEDYTVPWKERIGRWYKELQDNDPEVKAKAEALSGFIGRPEYDGLITRHNQRKTSNKHFRLDQHAFIYGVHQWCRDNNGKTLSSKAGLNIILHHYNLDKANLTPSDIKLLSGGKLFRDGSLKNMPAYAERARDFFEPKVLAAQRRYELGIRGRPGNNTVEAVTRSMEATTLQASDPAPARSTNPPSWRPPPPPSRERPNTNDPFNVSRLHPQQATSSNTSQYNPHGQRLQLVPYTSHQPPPQPQDFRPVPQNAYQRPSQGHFYPSGSNAMFPQPTLQGMDPPSSFQSTILQRQGLSRKSREHRRPALLPSEPPAQAMGPPPSLQAARSQREELSRRSKDSGEPEKRSNDPDPSQSPKGSKDKKRCGARDGHK